MPKGEIQSYIDKGVKIISVVVILYAAWYAFGILYGPGGQAFGTLSQYILPKHGLPQGMQSSDQIWHLIYMIVDYCLIAILLIFALRDSYQSYQDPQPKKAMMYGVMLVLLGFAWAWAIPYINQMLPFYSGGLPIMASLLTEGILPYLLGIVFTAGIIFNLRKRQ